MELTGTFKEIQIIPFKKKDGTMGEKAMLVITVQQGEYENDIAFLVWKENTLIAAKKIVAPAEVEVRYNIKSRKYQDKWYTDVEAWNIKYDALKEAPSNLPQDNTSIEDVDDDEGDGLPF
jgi:hypothetical protein